MRGRLAVGKSGKPAAVDVLNVEKRASDAANFGDGPDLSMLLAVLLSAMRNKFSLVLPALLAVAGIATRAADTARVLFIGNSFTGVNDLPETFR